MSTPSTLANVKALTFDVFGTVVDWRSSVIAQCEAFGAQHRVATDWGRFADRWRHEGYYGPIRDIVAGRAAPRTADALHREKLGQLLDELGATHVSEAARDEWNLAWHRLDPWPDAVAGLARLRQRYIVCTLSNGNFRLLVDMARHARLGWDAILTADLIGAFKPEAGSYLGAARVLGLQPGEVMMVAAHKADLRAAQSNGLRAGFVPRPEEAGPHVKVDLTPDAAFDVVATDFLALADVLGC
jgi:2-haloacid dehalogenase